jgi:hypothetical protein
MDDTLELALVDPSNTKSYQDDKQNAQFSNAETQPRLCSH